MDTDLETLFRAHHATVFRAAYRLTGDASDAEDVLQTVFLRLLRREVDLSALENAESYLRRAAVNAALDLLRSRRSARSISIDDAEPQVDESPAFAPERTFAAGEIRDWLRQTIARLSPRVAEMFALRFFEGKDNPEIARLLNTTQGTVAVTLSRTRDRLEKEYRAYVGGKQ